MQILCHLENSAVEAALTDLWRDLAAVAPPAAPDFTGWTVAVEISDTLATETFVLEITDDRRILISGGDALGAVYGIYEFSHRFLGVDPLWFWKNLDPAPLEQFEPAAQRIESGTPAFRYRGWFINDEDLLGRWREPAGERFRDWPGREQALARPVTEFEDNYDYRLLQYYTPIVAESTMGAVFEALLRLRGNLIIPASFIDVMNAPEAEIIRAAIRRGLYVSQHHVEPLGVSHFAYDTWWAKQGETQPFSYREAPDAMRKCWRAYAERWQEIAGDHLIWQVGLRGKGDRPLWNHDPEARAWAGEFIASALDDQMVIIRSVDPRPSPPATLTLWLEGADLIKRGALRAPEGVIYVFADHARTQEMQDDFAILPRESGRGHGAYYHVAVWTMGPHLVQGPPPEKVAGVIRSFVEKGDTDYAILNVANVREHLMGATVWLEQVWEPAGFDRSEFLRRWAPPDWAPFYEELLEAIPELTPGWRLYDGTARSFIDGLLRALNRGQVLGGYLKQILDDDRSAAVARFTAYADRLNRLRERLVRHDPPEAWRTFFQANLVVQTTILEGLYRTIAVLMADPTDFPAAAAALRNILAAYPLAETGRWKHWYRGDTKVGVASLLERVERLGNL